MNQYTLPDLPYDYGALEPVVSARTMELHHDKHHRAYVESANQTLEKLAEARASKDFANISALERALAFSVSGHLLHSLLWRNLRPGPGGGPKGELRAALVRDFGSVATFKNQLGHAASTLMGSGWATLVWDPILGRLTTLQIQDHQAGVIQTAAPLLVVDMWEHAYYLEYQSDKARYLDGIGKHWNWDDVAERYRLARQVDVGLTRVAA